MDRITFDIFIPDEKKFRLTPNWIMSVLWFVPLLLLWLIKGNHSGPPGDLETIYFACVFLLSAYYLITSFFKYQPLNGKMEGKIEFQEDCIIICTKKFELKDISSLDFQFSDYYDKPPTSGRDFNPKISQGVGNNVSFTDGVGNAHLIWFRFQGKHSYLSLSAIINESVKTNKISVYRAQDLIGEENVLK